MANLSVSVRYCIDFLRMPTKVRLRNPREGMQRSLWQMNKERITKAARDYAYVKYIHDNTQRSLVYIFF